MVQREKHSHFGGSAFFLQEMIVANRRTRHYSADTARRVPTGCAAKLQEQSQKPSCRNETISEPFARKGCSNCAQLDQPYLGQSLSIFLFSHDDFCFWRIGYRHHIFSFPVPYFHRFFYGKSIAIFPKACYTILNFKSALFGTGTEVFYEALRGYLALGTGACRGAGR